MKKNFITLLILPFLIACGNDRNTEEARFHEEGLDPVSNAVVYADGWNELVIEANMAKTTISNIAHFATDRNACGKPAYGAISLENWNKLTTAMNSAAKVGLGTREHCFPAPETGEKYMDGNVDMKFDNKKVRIFENKDYQLCTTISDRATAETLLNTLHKVVIQADKEECPNGWGSA